MNQLFNNIKFNYLYRDGSNYKNYGNVVIGNPKNISLNEIEKSLRENLIDGEFFYAEHLNIPSLFFEVANCDDHEFHEFQGVEITDDPKCIIMIEEFIKNIIKT